MLVGTKAYEVTLQFLLHLMQPQQGELRFFAGLAELIFQGFAELVAAKDGIITLSADLQHLCLKSLKPRGLLLAGGLGLLEGFGLGRRQLLVGTKAYEVTLQLLLHLMQLQQGALRFLAGLHKGGVLLLKLLVGFGQSLEVVLQQPVRLDKLLPEIRYLMSQSPGRAPCLEQPFR